MREQTSLNAMQSDVDKGLKIASDLVSASSLKLTHYVPPQFPMEARQRALSGWVEVQFVVRTDGSVGEVTIVGAQPVGIFEQAAMDAVRKWQYRPVLRDDRAVNQRARVRLQFALKP